MDVRQRIMGRLQRHFPQPIVAGKITVIITLGFQIVAQQGEMVRLFICNLNPVGIKGRRQSTKAVGRIPGKIDGVEFDMGQGMQKSRAAFVARQFAQR